MGDEHSVDDITVTLSLDLDEGSSNESWVIIDVYVALVDEETGCWSKAYDDW